MPTMRTRDVFFFDDTARPLFAAEAEDTQYAFCGFFEAAAETDEDEDYDGCEDADDDACDCTAGETAAASFCDDCAIASAGS
jgi:hypothetical protein